ncbi:MAG TPA: T9SS type A sorting domain-containing protein, partial [Chitinophagales bacterium]|nr:T9SS type A sorting domain-containing protein [Chitinophagales bacterium]
ELDPASVVNLASSHPYTEFTITGTGILRWFFNPIYLPDSLTNPLGSQGFVMFSIKRKQDLAPGHAINNTAHIYFDYNEAVVTNTISSTIATPVGIKTVASQSNVSAQAYPNPFTSETFIAVKGAEKGSSLAVSDITGKRLMEMSIPDNGLINVKRDKLASGLYFYAVLTNGRQMATGRLIAE